MSLYEFLSQVLASTVKFELNGQAFPIRRNKMIYTIGSGWGWGYLILGFIALIGGGIWAYARSEERESPVPQVIGTIVLTILFGYLSLYAFTHYKVGINERSLLINTIEQKVEGVRDSGIQKRPILGVKTIDYPAFTLKAELKMGDGISSATAKNGMGIYNAVTVYFDTREMDIEKVFHDYNGNWDKFQAEFLRPQMMNIARDITTGYEPEELTTKRKDWQAEFDSRASVYLAASGYNITIIPSQTTMSWDFVSAEDAKAYEEAKRAGYLQEVALKKKAALQVEADMAEIRAAMLTQSATGSVDALKVINEYLASVDPSIRPYIMEYLQTQVDLEYLRLVAEQKPDFIFPPGSNPSVQIRQSELQTAPTTTP